MKKLLLALGLLVLAHGAVYAQGYQRVLTCGSASPPNGTSPGYMDANGNICVGTPSPSSGSGTGITPTVSGSLEASHVLKASGGNLYSVYASNLTGGTSGFLLVLNATSAPGDGAVTPLVCVPFSGGVAQAAYINIPPAVFSTGITAVVSSAATCFTKTTGVLTAFISGLVK